MVSICIGTLTIENAFFYYDDCQLIITLFVLYFEIGGANTSPCVIARIRSNPQLCRSTCRDKKDTRSIYTPPFASFSR